MGFVLFPSSPLNERVVDEAFQTEYTNLQYSDTRRALVDQDLLAATGMVHTRQLPEGTDRGLYRGWMLTTGAYAVLYAALTARGLHPITSPAAYQRAHLLPGWLGTFADLTPPTAFVPPTADEATIRLRAAELLADAFVVKDHVKSRKHEWATACYAPDLDHLPQIVTNFVALQGEFLTGQVAIRAFVPLDGNRPEVRVWWAHGAPALITRHPDAPADAPTQVEDAFLERVSARVGELGTAFVTTDIAWDEHGRPLVIEVGDGQVSGLPDDVDEAAYQQLVASLLA